MAADLSHSDSRPAALRTGRPHIEGETPCLAVPSGVDNMLYWSSPRVSAAGRGVGAADRREATMSLFTARSSRQRLAAVTVGLAVIASAAAAATAAPGQPSQGSPPVPQVVPKPASMTVGSGSFTLHSDARIVADKHSGASQVAQALAGHLRPATGFRLPVVNGN